MQDLKIGETYEITHPSNMWRGVIEVTSLDEARMRGKLLYLDPTSAESARVYLESEMKGSGYVTLGLGVIWGLKPIPASLENI